ncbi:MAG: hypothetical protein ACC683_00275 [Acidimicrobiia bacterium]
MLDVNVIVVLGASLVLVAVAVGVSMYLRLGVERSIVWASVRGTPDRTHPADRHRWDHHR